MDDELCPHCRRGAKIESSYTLSNSTVVHDDSYCGWCGTNWNAPVKKADAPLRALAHAVAKQLNIKVGEPGLTKVGRR